MADKLRVLLTVRERTVDEARQALAACVAAETAAMDAIRAVDATIHRERAAADRFNAAQPLGSKQINTQLGREMFAAWSVRARALRQAAVMRLAEAEVRTGEARAVLGAARTAVRVAERLVADREEARRAAAEALDMHALDDIGRERHRARSKSQA